MGDVAKLPQRNLMDVPGMLRHMANDIEAGDYGEVKSLLVIMPREGIPMLFNWGEHLGTHDVIFELELAKKDQLEEFLARVDNPNE